IVGVLVYSGSGITAAEAQQKYERGKKTDDAVVGYDKLVATGISPGVLKPLIVLVENNHSPSTVSQVVSRVGATPGISGAVAPPAWHKGATRLVEAFPSVDSAAPAAAHTAS